MTSQRLAGIRSADQIYSPIADQYPQGAAGKPKQAFPVIERAQRMAELLVDRIEQVRLTSVLANSYYRTYSYDESVRASFIFTIPARWRRTSGQTAARAKSNGATARLIVLGWPY